MKRLLIDASHILKACLHASSGAEHSTLTSDGKILPSAIDGYQYWIDSLKKTLNYLKMTPCQVVFVKDGANASAMRRAIMPGYKDRKPGIDGFHDEFLKLQKRAEDNLVSYGAIAVHKDGVEADDMIAALAKVTDHLIWSGDKDLQAAGDVFFKGEINSDKFLGIAKKHIVVYKSLIGDASDNIPGCTGFGPKAFLSMIEKYGDDCLDEFLEMLEKRTLHDLESYVGDFKPFKKIVDSADQIYQSYQCARFHHPGWHDIQWRAEYPKGDGTFPEWDLKIELITKGKLTDKFIDRFTQQLLAAPWGPSLDIETWMDEESLAWGWANKSKTSKGPRLDVFGSHMAGFSITTGENNNLVYYFPVDHADTDNITVEDMKRLINCCDESKPMFVFNAEFELPVIRNHMELRFDRGWLPNINDVLIMKSYVNENTPLRLKYCSSEYLGHKQVTFEEVTAYTTEERDEDEENFTDYQEDSEGEEKEDVEDLPTRQMNTLTGEEVLLYGADDSICTGALANLFSLVMKYEETWSAYTSCELSTAYLCAEGFLCGQKFDLNRLSELTEENLEQQRKQRGELDQFLIQIEWEEGDQLDGSYWTNKLEGCEFIPATSLAAAEIKKVYLQITKTKLKTTARKVPAIAAAMIDTLPELAEILLDDESGDMLERFNDKAVELFIPKPTLDIGSPKQICHLLYTAFGFPVRLRGKLTPKMREKGQRVGNPKGDESAIRHAIMYDASDMEREILERILSLKALQTDRSLYLLPYAKMNNPKDGMVHGSYGQSRQKTRRFSSTSPNRTQLSTKSPIRQVYVPAFPDHVIVSFDEAGQELRHTARQSQDPIMLSCFIGENKKDIHSITGRAIMALKGNDITYDEFISLLQSDDESQVALAKKHRGPAKTCNFLDIYGGTAASLAEKLLIPLEEAENILNAKHNEFGGVEQWKEIMKNVHRERGYALTPLGARKHCHFNDTWKDQHEFRSALNSIIQGGSAEQIKMAMTTLWDMKITDIFECVFLFPCHDELVFSCQIDQVVDFCRTVHQVMTAPFADMDMPWESSIEIGWNYGRLKEFDTFDAYAITKHIEELKNERQ